MKRRRPLLLVLAALGMLGYWTASAQSNLDLVSVDQASWWSQRPGATPVGDGKIEVANSVRGEESVAALRVLIRGDVTKATLVLAESSAPLAAAVPGKIRVCTTDQPWLLIDGGKWDDRPQEDCSQGVELTRAADGNGIGTWSGDVTAMLRGPRSEVSLMVVPSADQGSLLDSTWLMTLVPRVAAEGTPDIAPTTVVAAPTPTVNGGGSAPPRVASSPSAAPTPTTAAAAAAPATQEPKRFQVAASSKPGKPWGKLIFPLLPLAAILALLYTAAQRYVTERNASSA